MEKSREMRGKAGTIKIFSGLFFPSFSREKRYFSASSRG
jgi:hypothetical protein